MRFPLHRLRLSLAYGLPRLYRRILAHTTLPKFTAKPSLDLTLLIFGGEAHLPLIRESLASLQTRWRSSPRLHLVSDGSLLPGHVDEIFTWWPAPARLSDWSELAAEITPRGPEGLLLTRFAEREVMARKLTAIVASALAEPTLYTDADVLWFGDVDRLEPLEKTDRQTATLKISQDTHRSYDRRLVPEMLPALAEEPPWCAGFLYARGDLLDACDIRRLLERAASEGVGSTEQTIVAEMARQLGGSYWPLSVVESRFDDRERLTPSFPGAPWVARHYVAPARHIFWHDAFHARIRPRWTR